MPIDNTAVGREATITAEVGDELTADHYGNAGLHVLATPALVGLFERAAIATLDGLLTAGERSVGSVVDIRHLAPTPAGSSVSVTARLTSIDGRQVWFELEAADGAGPIGEGRHSRFIVDERFQRKIAERGG
jgi:predicted thioesterase